MAPLVDAGGSALGAWTTGGAGAGSELTGGEAAGGALVGAGASSAPVAPLSVRVWVGLAALVDCL